MKVSELGEFPLIDRINKVINELAEKKADSWRRLLIGIGDDTAVWKSRRHFQLTKVDCLVQGVHFPKDIVKWTDLGWKSLAVSLSDIAAMGGKPTYALISLAFPPETVVDDVLSLYGGMMPLANRFGVAIAGGNISHAPVLVINTFVSGEARSESGLLRRSAARVGDKIAVTGKLGGAAAGLRLLVSRYQETSNPGLKEAFLRPVPRIKEAQILVKYGVRAAIDISDGFIADLGHLCRASGVGARVNTDAVPIAPAARFYSDEALDLALAGGEDYELLFTGPEELMNRLIKHFEMTVIGEITEIKDEIVLADSKGNPYELKASGWDHFKR